MSPRKPSPASGKAEPLDAEILARVLRKTEESIVEARDRGRLKKEGLSRAIYFSRNLGSEVARALGPDFGHENVLSGEVESASSEGAKRLDVSYSTPEGGLGLMVSLKSVHQGEENEGNARFTHNLKRNDEELRVEATAFHLRQPYSVLAAVVILPFEACHDSWAQKGDGRLTSSFGRWVQKLWSLKGRVEPDDPPNLFELVFVLLYRRDGSGLGFYEVGGKVGCPRTGQPKELLSFTAFIDRLKSCYFTRNRKDFHFDGEDVIPLTDQEGLADD